MVKIFANLNGLASTYLQASVVNDSGKARAFFRGINEAFPSFDVIDAGLDKGGADAKVQGESMTSKFRLISTDSS